MLGPPLPGLPWSPRGRDEAGKQRFPSRFQDATSRGEGLAASGGSGGIGLVVSEAEK